jgi:hypothetical protein
LHSYDSPVKLIHGVPQSILQAEILFLNLDARLPISSFNKLKNIVAVM